MPYFCFGLLNCTSLVLFEMEFEVVEDFLLFFGGYCVATLLLASF